MRSVGPNSAPGDGVGRGVSKRRKVGGEQKRSENRALKVYAFGGAPTPTGSASSIAKCYLNVAMSEMRARPVLHGVRLRRWKREGREKVGHNNTKYLLTTKPAARQIFLVPRGCDDTCETNNASYLLPVCESSLRFS